MSESKNMMSNLLWRFAERCGAQGVTLVVQIVLARLLMPEVYATIALVNVVIILMTVFVDSGLGTALVQKKDADDVDFSSVFYCNLMTGIVLYLALFAVAPWISRFYRDDALTPVIRVLGIMLVISSVKNVQIAYVSRNMQFKRFFFATLGGTLGAAVIGITMAYMGFGVWALAAQYLFNEAVDTLILWLTVKWRPKLVFSFRRLKELFSFGWKLLVSALLDALYNNLNALVIGKLYRKEDLAFFNRGSQFPMLIITNVNTSIDSVMLPVLSRVQEYPDQVKQMTRRAMVVSTFVMAPLLLGLAAVGEPLVRILLTEKWMPSVPFLQVFCLVFLLYPLQTANLNAIKAVGRSDLFLKLEIIKKVIGLGVVLTVARMGVMALMYGQLITGILALMINSWPNRKLIGYGFPEQVRDILPGFLAAFAMALCVAQLSRLGLPDLLTIALQVLSGAVLYVGISAVFRLEAFSYLLGILKGFRGKAEPENKE